MKLPSFILFAVTVLFFFSAKSQSTFTLEASKDTYINTIIADQYQGQVQSLIAAGWTYGGSFGQGRSLLGFELCDLPDSFVLVSATLHLFQDFSASHDGHTTNGLNSARLYQITSAWDESTTWSSQPTYDQNSFSIIPSSNSSSQDYSIDVTGIVTNAISNSNEVGFYLKLDNEISYRSLVFASKDHPNNGVRPKLEIQFYTDTNWCSTSTSSPNNVENCVENLTVPNVFTPNGDSINDDFNIGFECAVSSFHIEIFNRWGNVIFESNKADFVWDGTSENDGEKLNEGTYFYRIIFLNGQDEVKKSGLITLLR